jgi:hypothetical protein
MASSRQRGLTAGPRWLQSKAATRASIYIAFWIAQGRDLVAGSPREDREMAPPPPPSFGNGCDRQCAYRDDLEPVLEGTWRLADVRHAECDARDHKRHHEQGTTQSVRRLVCVVVQAARFYTPAALVSRTYACPPAFFAWLATFPDLDAEEHRRNEARLLASPELGATVADRERALRRTARIVKAFNRVSHSATMDLKRPSSSSSTSSTPSTPSGDSQAPTTRSRSSSQKPGSF